MHHHLPALNKYLAQETNLNCDGCKHVFLTDCNLYADQLTDSVYFFPELHSNHIWWQPSIPNLSIHWPCDLYRPISRQHGKQSNASTWAFKHVLTYMFVKRNQTRNAIVLQISIFVCVIMYVWVVVHVKPKPLVNQNQIYVYEMKFCVIYYLSLWNMIEALLFYLQDTIFFLP